jgi:hypothetical protein
VTEMTTPRPPVTERPVPVSGPMGYISEAPQTGTIAKEKAGWIPADVERATDLIGSRSADMVPEHAAKVAGRPVSSVTVDREGRPSLDAERPPSG